MGTNEFSQPASKSSWDSQDFGDINMVLKMARFRKSTGPRWVNIYPQVPVGKLLFVMSHAKHVDCNYMSLPLIPASGITFPIWPHRLQGWGDAPDRTYCGFRFTV